MVIEYTPVGTPEPTSVAQKVRAAEYVRMAAVQQQLPSDSQREAIRRYADEHGYEIVKTYADHGKSGLSLVDRTGLKLLLHDMESRQADYDALLVYDVSRWGRFHDPDEVASLELRCRRAGVIICYCCEQAGSDDGISLSAITTIKRAAAGITIKPPWDQ